MKKVLEIQEFEDKKTNSGKSYVRFKTSEGWMSCFDTKSCDELKRNNQRSVNVEVIQQGEFTNIKKFLGPASESSEEVDAEVEKPGTSAPVEKKLNGKKEMYVSYAKDCFCAMCTRISQSEFDNMEEEQRLALMDLAVKAVKKAESAF